ncbi:MAG: SUMF1/EgtB/PvdO family nonheme iron enzyme [Prochloraceae cyanobacterium]|nr:SUMF1/EgtB/PvdO family nonheme iron enzyme [Prochloraceae cyanobacterium]
MNPDILGGRYQIVKGIGEGSFGKTYLVKDIQNFDSLCALKQLKPLFSNSETFKKAKSLFEREARKLHELGKLHDRIPSLLAYFSENEQFYLVQEFIEGHDLTEELIRGTRFSSLQVITLLKDILEPLAVIHQKRLIHRDIKPSNLMRRDRDGKIVLIDFGAIGELAATQIIKTSDRPQVGTIIGTPGYMPIEQQRGLPKLSSDIYAVGVIGIQALTGILPKNLEQDPTTKELIWHDLAQVNPELRDVLDKMVRYHFSDRYPNALAALSVLQELVKTDIKKSSSGNFVKKDIAKISPKNFNVNISIKRRKLIQLAALITVGFSLTSLVKIVLNEYFFNSLRELKESQKLWQSRNFKTYQYIYKNSKRFQILVTEDRVISAMDLQTGRSVSDRELESYKTIDTLFKDLENHLKSKERNISVIYDSELGHPIEVTIDSQEGTENDGIYFAIEELIALNFNSFETIIVDSRGREIDLHKKEAAYFTENLGNSIFLEMVAIAGGSFLMGSPTREKGSNKNERPQQKVTISPFFLGKFQVTQAQWSAVANLPKVKRNLNPKPSFFEGNNLPVEKISWYDAVEFCQRLSQKTDRQYRLPSEAEWEYACRAGIAKPFHFGDTLTSDLANYNSSYTYASEPLGEYRQKTTPAGSYPPNAFGLYDMHGNVWEWCADVWHPNYEGLPTDGKVWTTKLGHSKRSPVRGGSWSDLPVKCRSASRHQIERRDNRLSSVGFRVLLVYPNL